LSNNEGPLRLAAVRGGHAIRDLTLGGMVARQAERLGDKVYLTFLPDGRRYTYRDLDTHSNRIANGLLSLGLPARPHISMFMENSPEFLFTLVAIAKIGGVAAPVNAAARGDQLRHMFDLFDAVAVAVEQPLLPRLLEILPACPKIQCVVVVPSPENPGARPEQGDAHGRRVVTYAELDACPETAPGVEVKFSDLFMLAFTSGTTGPSKGNMHTHAKVLLDPIHNLEVWGCSDRDVFFTALPAFHNNAQTAALFPALAAGASAVMARRFSASNFWKDMRATGATVVSLLGSMTNMLWAQPPTPEDRNHSLRVVRAAPVPSFHAEFERRFGVVLTGGYGLTDFGVPTSLPADAPPSKKLSMGRPRPGWQVRIVDDDDFDMPTGEPGEMVLRTDLLWQTSLGYYKMPEATLAAFQNGWFHTGDRAYCDADGYLYFVDRKKDAIRRRGENISAYEVEQIIQKHPGIAEAAVFAVRSDMSEDEVGVALVRREGASVSELELTEYCRNNMAYFMVPRYLKFVDLLPRTLTQKVEKYRLKDDAEKNPAGWWDRVAAGIIITRG
jgi:crotonobetaine/carnitine-CoA ligase